jgi:hypothetical protein
VEVRLAGKALEVATDYGIRLGELRYLLFRGTLARAAHIINESLAMEGGTDDTRGCLQG